MSGLLGVSLGGGAEQCSFEDLGCGGRGVAESTRARKRASDELHGVLSQSMSETERDWDFSEFENARRVSTRRRSGETKAVEDDDVEGGDFMSPRNESQGSAPTFSEASSAEEEEDGGGGGGGGPLVSNGSATGLPLDFYQCALFFGTCEGSDRKSQLFRTLEHRATQLRKTLDTGRHKFRAVSASVGSSRRLSERTEPDKVSSSGVSLSRLNQVYTRYRMLCAATCLLVLQVTLMHQLLFSVERRSCASSRDCVRGTSCSHKRHRQGEETNICTRCPRLANGNETRRVEAACFRIFDSEVLLRRYDRNDVPQPQVHFAGHEDRADGFSPAVFVEFCAGCVDDDGTYKTLDQVVRLTLRAMRLGDFLTLFVCASAVGLTMVAELREIKIAVMAQKACFWRTSRRGLAHSWFAALTNVRHYLLLPQIVATVPRLVLFEGSDTVSLIFNTVSVIFVTELDNLLTKRLISVPTHRLLSASAQVYATDRDHRYLGKLQKSYMIGIVALVFLGLYAEVWLRFNGVSFLLALLGAYLAGLTEVYFFKDQPLLTRVLLAADVAKMHTALERIRAAYQTFLNRPTLLASLSRCCCFRCWPRSRRVDSGREKDPRGTVQSRAPKRTYNSASAASIVAGSSPRHDANSASKPPRTNHVAPDRAAAASPTSSMSTLTPPASNFHLARLPRGRRRRKNPCQQPSLITLDIFCFSIEFFLAVGLPLLILNFITGAVFGSLLDLVGA